LPVSESARRLPSANMTAGPGFLVRLPFSRGYSSPANPVAYCRLAARGRAAPFARAEIASSSLYPGGNDVLSPFKAAASRESHFPVAVRSADVAERGETQAVVPWQQADSQRIAAASISAGTGGTGGQTGTVRCTGFTRPGSE